MARTKPAEINPIEDDDSGQERFVPSSWKRKKAARAAAETPDAAGAPPAPATGFMSAGLHSENVPGLGKPEPYLLKALAKKPGDRTPQEVEALKQRSRVEEITAKRGGKVVGGIMSDLITEERASGIGRREAKAAIGYYEGSEKEMAASGRAPDGTKLDPEASKTTVSTAKAPSKAAAKTAAAVTPAAADEGTSGGTITKDGKTTTVEAKAPAGAAAPAELPPDAKPAIGAGSGFAMRTMPDGSVRTASGVDGSGRSIMQDFATKEAAMALFLPVPKAGSPAAPAPGQPAQPAAPAAAAPAAPTAPVAPPVGQDLDANLTPGAPTPVVSTQQPAPQTPEAARTTSPTAKLEMAGGTPGAAPATPSAAPAPGAPDLGGVPTSEVFAQTTGARPSPGSPAIGFGAGVSELFGRGTKNAIWNTPDASGQKNLYGDTPKNPFSEERADYAAKGTPRPRGFQENAENLSVR